LFTVDVVFFNGRALKNVHCSILGQGLNLSHSGDLSCSCCNAGSFNLRCWAGSSAPTSATAVEFLPHHTIVGTPIHCFLGGELGTFSKTDRSEQYNLMIPLVIQTLSRQRTFPSPQKVLSHLSVNPCLPPQRQPLSGFYPHSLALPLLELHRMESMECIYFCAGLVSFRVSSE